MDEKRSLPPVVRYPVRELIEKQQENATQVDLRLKALERLEGQLRFVQWILAALFLSTVLGAKGACDDFAETKSAAHSAAALAAQNRAANSKVDAESQSARLQRDAQSAKLDELGARLRRIERRHGIKRK